MNPHTPYGKNNFGQTIAKMGSLSQKGLCYGFEILHGLISNKNIGITLKKMSPPPHPTLLKKAIVGRQKYKWAVIGARNIRYDFLMNLQKGAPENFHSYR